MWKRYNGYNSLIFLAKERSLECQMETVTHSEVLLVEKVTTNISDELHESLQGSPVRISTGKK